MVSSTTITATTPAGSAGAVTVTVTDNGAERKSGQRIHLQRGSGDRFRAGGIGHAAIGDGDGAGDLSGGADSRRPERGGGGMERHHLDRAVGEGQCRQHLQVWPLGRPAEAGLQQSIYYAANIRAGSNTVTVTFSQAAAYPDMRILEYRGVTTLDVTAGASGE